MTAEEKKIRQMRKLHRQIREEFDVDMLHGQWSGSRWEEAEKAYAERKTALGLI
jgi:hypothetical protein